ncbi:MAG: hypothetical protein NT038_00740, partial [Euryarchaeota archaeon]|nr:hypothetical protein [Euryarchaeota archaeon]
IPCYGMKHFFAEYISPYPYTSGFSAVVIAKYYEGAYINGTLQSNNTPLPYAQVIIFDKYGIPHDITYTNSSGVFHLIAPAGNITLTFSYNAGNGNQVLLKEITFNSMTNPLFAQISDADAMRLPGSNYNRILDLSVNLSTLEGYVYEDRNDNESYDPAIDTLIPGVTVQLEDQYFGRSILPTVTDTNGHYIFYNLFPSKYNASLIENGEVLATNDPFNVVPNYNFINISKP